MLAESMTVGRYWATCSFPMSFGHPLLASSDSCTRDRSKDRGFSTSGFASQIYVDSPRFHNLPPNQTSSFYVPSWLALFHLSSHRPVPSGASGFPCKVNRVQVAQWVHICGTRHGWSWLPFLLVPGDTRLMAKIFNPCFDYGMIQRNKLVGGFNTEKYESQLGWLFPRYGKIEHVWKTPTSKKFDRWKITRDGLANWASRVASLAFSLRWMAAVLKQVPELALRKASGLVWLDQQNVIAYHCSFGPLLIVDGFSWLSVGLLST